MPQYKKIFMSSLHYLPLLITMLGSPTPRAITSEMAEKSIQKPVAREVIITADMFPILTSQVDRVSAVHSIEEDGPQRTITVPGIGTFSAPQYSLMEQFKADKYCQELISDDIDNWILPTEQQLLELYKVYPNNTISTVLNWNTEKPYWSRTPSNFVRSHYYNVTLAHGSTISDVFLGVGNYVVCISNN